MRVDPSRAPVLALWCVAMLAILGLPGRAIAQPPPGPGGLPSGASPGPGPAGPPGGQMAPPGGFAPPGQPQAPGSEGEGEAPETLEATIDHDAVPTDTSSLARFIPSMASGLFFEFHGLNASPDAWQGSSAFEVLNESSLGEMLRVLIAQFIEAAPNAPAGVMTGPEVVAVLEHIARQGLVIASPQDEDRQANEVILVLRKAAHREARPVFGKLIGTIAAEGTNPEVVEKPGNRQIVVMDAPAFNLEGSRDWAWWVEQDDLVLVFNGADAADRVIAVLDGEQPSAEDDPVRQQLMTDEGGFRPLAFGTWQLDRPGASPYERSLVDESGLNRVNLRWGFDGMDSLTVVTLDAPAPREGLMAVFDQPAIPMSELPPIPREVGNLSIVSANPAEFYDALVILAEQSMPGVAEQLRDMEESARSRGRLDLRDDILASLGPKLAAYTLPRPAAAREGSGNPLSGIMNALGGLGLPQFVVAIEVDDAAAFTSKLDGMILAINQQLAQLLPPPEEPAEEPEPATAPGVPPPGGQAASPGGRRGSSQRPPDPPEPPRFSMTLAEPRTFSLRLPEGLYGLTGYQPTITMGRSHLIIASNPVAARQCRELEQGDPSDRWSPPGDLARRIPGNLTSLVVNDASDSLPSAIASLPARLNAMMLPLFGEPAQDDEGPAAGLAQGAQPGGPPGASPAPGMSAPPGIGPAPGMSAPPGIGPAPGMSAPPGIGPPPGGSPPGIGGPPGFPGSPGGAGGQQSNAPAVRLDPSLIPPPESLRGYLGRAVYTVSADDAGIRIEARETLPGQWSLDGLGSGANLLPSMFLPQGDEN